MLTSVRPTDIFKKLIDAPFALARATYFVRVTYI
jgi:hypothetical protein